MDSPDDAQLQENDFPAQPWLQPYQDPWTGAGGRQDVSLGGDGGVGWSDEDWARWLSQSLTETQPNTRQSSSDMIGPGRGSLAASDR
eukprot:2102569-Pyramimonas_sp.AAC.1